MSAAAESRRSDFAWLIDRSAHKPAAHPQLCGRATKLPRRGRPTTASLIRELTLPTPSSRWHFSVRAAAPLRKRSFAIQAREPAPTDSSRSQARPDRRPQARGSTTASEGFEFTPPTHRSRLRSSQRVTGLLWNLTFADAAEKVRDGESGHSQVAITDLGKAPAERLHPKAAYSRCRISAVSRKPGFEAGKRRVPATFRQTTLATGGAQLACSVGRDAADLRCR